MRSNLALLFVVLLIGCNERQPPLPPFKELEWYYDDTWNTAFTLKFTSTDTVFVQQHFVSRRNTNTDTLLKAKRNYYGILTRQQKDSLYASVRGIPINQYDSSYSEIIVQDGRTINVCIETDSVSKHIHVLEGNGPIELWDMGNWLIKLKTTVRWKPIAVPPNFQLKYNVPEIDPARFVPPTN